MSIFWNFHVCHVHWCELLIIICCVCDSVGQWFSSVPSAITGLWMRGNQRSTIMRKYLPIKIIQLN